MAKLQLKLSTLEIIVFILFLVYLLFPLKTPGYLSPAINHPLGLLTVIILTISIFIYSSPILGVLAIIVAYELLRRSCVPKHVKHVRFDEPTQSKKDSDMKKMNPPSSTTLEESLVEKMSPMQKTQEYLVSSYKPVSENTHHALVLK
jgi:hypothetical protein